MNVPAIPAGTIAEAVASAKDFLRIGSGDGGAGESAALTRFAASAFALGEAFTGRAFIVRAFEDVIDPTGRWRVLMAEPVTAIAGVSALPIDGAPFVLGADGYAIDIDAEGVGWLRVGGDTRVAVSYTAGIAANWDALPAPLAQGVVALIAHLFDNRDGGKLPPAAVAALWRPFRRMSLTPSVHSA